MKWTYALITGLFFQIGLLAQELNSYHQSLVNQIQKNTIINHLQSFEDFGIKTVGSEAETNAYNWLKGYYQDWGYTDIQEQNVTVFGLTGKNLIVTKTGTHYPDQFIVICAHYDTIYGPGTNDNGSGTSILLEMARILKNVSTEYSIKFIHFTGEEWGLHGSQQFVDEIVLPQNLDIKLVFNIDEVGGVAGEVNDSVTCEYDASFPQSNNSASMNATLQLGSCMELYSDLYADYSYAYASDYEPFQEEGFIITGLYESNESDHPHSSSDNFQNLDSEYIYQVGKGALGALCFFAKAYQELETQELNSNFAQVYPNPVRNQLFIKTNFESEVQFQLIDLNGKLIQSGKFNGNLYQINTQNLAPGIYQLNLIKGKNVENHKIIVQPN